VYVDADQWERFAAVARAHDRSRSAQVRELIRRDTGAGGMSLTNLPPSAQLDPGPYDHLHEEDFDGAYCGCGRRMHETDTECERCWRDREYPES
jgi:hypothetical protein